MSVKLGRVIFRRIHGKLIPIRITNTADKVAQASDYGGNKFRQIKAVLPSGETIGKMNLRVPKKGAHAEVISVNVEKQFKKKGISKNLFSRAVDFLNRAGKKFLRGEDIQHVAQAKIRSKAGWYKAGPKRKLRTKFIADQFGYYGEESKRIKPIDAINYIKQNNSKHSTGRQIKATTFIKKAKK